jgi:DNA repair protein RecO (recombination protein O)
LSEPGPDDPEAPARDPAAPFESLAPLGVVLRTAPLRESDLLVTLYTDVHGQVTAVARGARKSKRRFAGALSLLVLGRYQLGRRPRGELWGLESAEVVREWTSLATDVVVVAHASYIAELIGALMPVEAPEPHALDVIVGLWDALAAGGPSPGALRAAELALLDLAGHRPAIDRCAPCGETALDEGAVFDPQRGGAICRRCAAHSRNVGVRPFAPATRGYLEAVLALDTPLAARAVDHDPRFSPADRMAAREAIVAMVVGLAGKPLRSLEYLAKLGAAGRRAKD